MPEAPKNSPGHVGHTPQPIGRMLRRARAAALGTSPAAMQLPTEYAGQTLHQLAIHPARESTLQTLLAIERARQGLSERQPWPLAYRESEQPSRGTLGS
jgi:hypothetical protein